MIEDDRGGEWKNIYSARKSFSGAGDRQVREKKDLLSFLRTIRKRSRREARRVGTGQRNKDGKR